MKTSRQTIVDAPRQNTAADCHAGCDIKERSKPRIVIESDLCHRYQDEQNQSAAVNTPTALFVTLPLCWFRSHRESGLTRNGPRDVPSLCFHVATLFRSPVCVQHRMAFCHRVTEDTEFKLSTKRLLPLAFGALWLCSKTRFKRIFPEQ